MAGDRKIGVAMDFSSCSKEALRWAAENLVRNGDHLILVNVQKEVYESGEVQLWEASFVVVAALIPLSDMSDPTIAKKYGIKTDMEALDTLNTLARQKEVVIVMKIYWGDAREKICEAIDTIPLTCLVIGNRGLSKLKRHTHFAQLCLKSIHEAEPALPTVNTATVLAALIKAVDAKTREARAVAQNLAAGSGFNARTVELLRDCIDFYGEALDHLESAKEAVRAGDPGTRDAMLSAMISDFSTCDEGFEEFGVKSPLAVWCQTLRNMTDNCLAIASLARPQGGY
ncbi:hypothetical protein KSP39_PZI021096 [Platanthera zijinensis]|uniref:Pectinesterase inhibitor domain-containing protein n=1 Tax=Platanthera zijinensis TaxID=2320716 RepID=A0AAP0AWS4_9ASPA